MVASFLAKIWPPVGSFCRIFVNIVRICHKPVPIHIVIVHGYSGLNIDPVWYQLIVQPSSDTSLKKGALFISAHLCIRQGAVAKQVQPVGPVRVSGSVGGWCIVNQEKGGFPVSGGYDIPPSASGHIQPCT